MCYCEHECLACEASTEISKAISETVQRVATEVVANSEPKIREMIQSIDLTDRIEQICNNNLNTILSDVTIRTLKELTITAVLEHIKMNDLTGKIKETARQIVDAALEAGLASS